MLQTSIKMEYLATRQSIDRELTIITTCRNKLERHESYLQALLKKERQLLTTLSTTNLGDINHD